MAVKLRRSFVFNFRAIVRVLVAHEVAFAVVGGLAGVMRRVRLFIQDLDILYSLLAPNSEDYLLRRMNSEQPFGRPAQFAAWALAHGIARSQASDYVLRKNGVSRYHRRCDHLLSESVARLGDPGPHYEVMHFSHRVRAGATRVCATRCAARGGESPPDFLGHLAPGWLVPHVHCGLMVRCYPDAPRAPQRRR